MSETSTDPQQINAIFDAIAFSENNIVREGFLEGLQKGVEDGKEEGYHLGFHKGIETGTEIGYYEGVVNILFKFHDSGEFILSHKTLTILQKLKLQIKSFPHYNCYETDIVNLKQQIKSYFKQLCSLIKFDGLLIEKGLSF